MSSRLIQQQVYTRDREGIFRTNEGYDTVAKSAGLDNNFIKNTLHPYCVYAAPQELVTAGERDDSAYPPSRVIFNADNGDLVIGQNVFVSSDFTGNRSTTFSHNYVIPEELKKEYVKIPSKIFGINSFLTKYDIRDGKRLDELEQVDYEKFPSSGRIGALSQLGLDEPTLFKKLLHAVLSSVGSKRKVYLTLSFDGKVSSISEHANRLFEALYACIPYALRMKLGFMTYNKEPLGKQHIHVMVVENGSIRPTDRNIERDYIFDFTGQRFVNTDLPGAGADPELLDFLWSNLSNDAQLRAFFDFCEEALQGKEADAIQLPTYYQLYSLFKVKQGDLKYYENTREGIIVSILKYLDKNTIQQKPSLKKLLLTLLSKDAIAYSDFLPSADYIGLLLTYYPYSEEKRELENLFPRFIKRIYQFEGAEKVFPVLKQISSNKQICRSLIQQLWYESPALIQAYANHRLISVQDKKQIENEEAFWLENCPEFIATEACNMIWLERAKQLIVMSRGVERVERSGYFYTFFMGLYERGFIAFAASAYEIMEELIGSYSIENAKHEEFAAAGNVLGRVKRLELSTMAIKDRYDLILAISKAIDISVSDKDTIDALDRLGLGERRQAQARILELLEGRVNRQAFQRLILIYENEELEKSKEFYKSLLDYVHRNVKKDDNLFFDFIVFSIGHSFFETKRRSDSSLYLDAVEDFMMLNYPNLFKLKGAKKKLIADFGSGTAAQKRFKKIRLRQYPYVVRLLAKYWPLVASGIGIVVVGVSLVFLAFKYIPTLLPGYEPVQSNQPTMNSETSTPEVDPTQPAASQPEGTQPDAAQPDAAQPDAAQPDAAQSDAAQPDAAQPDAAQPDAAKPDPAQPQRLWVETVDE